MKCKAVLVSSATRFAASPKLTGNLLTCLRTINPSICALGVEVAATNPHRFGRFNQALDAVKLLGGCDCGQVSEVVSAHSAARFKQTFFESHGPCENGHTETIAQRLNCAQVEKNEIMKRYAKVIEKSMTLVYCELDLSMYSTSIRLHNFFFRII